MPEPPFPAANRPGPKPTLTQAEVIEAALELVDGDGLAGLNLRKLASRLGVSAMTPYGYFQDKTQLLDGMLGYALAAVQLDASSTAPWHQQLEHAMRGMHDALERHPGVIELILAEDASGRGRLEAFRRELIMMLTRSGLSRESSIACLRTLTSYVLGYTMLTRLRRRSGPRPPATPASFELGLSQIMGAVRHRATPDPAVPRAACQRTPREGM